MSDYRRQVEALLAGISFSSPTTYAWFGQPSPWLPPKVRQAMSAESARGFLLFNLELQLYNDFYRVGTPTFRRADPAGPGALGSVSLLEELSAANCGSGSWDDGWEIHGSENGRVGLRKDGLELWTPVGACLAAHGDPTVPGTRVSLRLPKELPSMSPGYYMALGDTEPTQDDDTALVRLYWHLTAEGAVHLMREITSALNQAGVPFKLKVVNDAAGFLRCDAGVLYCHGRDYEAVAGMLGGLYRGLEPYLRPGTPAFTKALAGGLGLAEDPGGGESFGQHRCRLLAEAMWAAHEQGRESVAERLRVVEDRFAEAGLSLDRPFLNPGSRDRYEFRVPARAHRPRRVAALGEDAPSPSPVACLRVAAEIGSYLCRRALWYRGRCTWLGAERSTVRSPTGADALVYRALGPELYSGTSGVALFLGFLHSATGDARLERAAIGATRQAIALARSLPEEGRLGLYSGWTGIALAVATLGALLGQEALLRQARQLVSDARRSLGDDQGFDLISGAAGAILALLRLRLLLGDDSLLEWAGRLADRLLATAERSEAGYSWKARGLPYRHNLTGLSHGTAGVGMALLELFRATGEARYRQAANRAFDYERYWFEPAVGNWPDFREGSAAGQDSRAYAAAWCHGAPGIALSRFRACEILDEEVCKAEALAALRTTRRLVETALASPGENFSLCHGLAGNAEVLHEGGRFLGEGCTGGVSLVHAVARAGMNRYAGPESRWPCGNGGGETPSLMLGLAGIGYFYLRLSQPAVPSVLLP